jgi:HrpA-like RNA helicase
MGSLPINQKPDLLRIDIQPLLISLESLKTGYSFRELLAHTPNPPPSRDIDIAVKSLQSMGALEGDESLSKLGRIIAKLPLEPWMAKTLVYGIMFKCLDPVITLAACLNIGRPVFSVGDLEGEERVKFMVKLKEKFGGEGGDQSDHLVMISAYNDFAKNAHFQRGYAEKWRMNLQTMRSIDQERKQIFNILGSTGLVPLSTWSTSQLGGPVLNRYARNNKLLLGIVNSAVYPNIAKLETRNTYQVLIPGFNSRMIITSACILIQRLSTGIARNRNFPRSIYLLASSRKSRKCFSCVRLQPLIGLL